MVGSEFIGPGLCPISAVGGRFPQLWPQRVDMAVRPQTRRQDREVRAITTALTEAQSMSMQFDRLPRLVIALASVALFLMLQTRSVLGVGSTTELRYLAVAFSAPYAAILNARRLAKWDIPLTSSTVNGT